MIKVRLCVIFTYVCFNVDHWRNPRVILSWIHFLFGVLAAWILMAALAFAMGAWVGWWTFLEPNILSRAERLLPETSVISSVASEQPQHICCWKPLFVSCSKQELCSPEPPCCYLCSWPCIPVLSSHVCGPVAALGPTSHWIYWSRKPGHPLKVSDVTPLYLLSFITAFPSFYPDQLYRFDDPSGEAFRKSPAPDSLLTLQNLRNGATEVTA